MPRVIISPVDYSFNTIKGLQNKNGECPILLLACEQDFKCLIFIHLLFVFLQLHAILSKYLL